MAVRLRCGTDTIVSAAKSKELPDDNYIGDYWHYKLSVELGVLAPIGVDENGADLWAFLVPSPQKWWVEKELEQETEASQEHWSGACAVVSLGRLLQRGGGI